MYNVYLVYANNDYNLVKAIFPRTPDGLANANNFADPNGWDVVEGEIPVPFFATPSIVVTPA